MIDKYIPIQDGTRLWVGYWQRGSMTYDMATLREIGGALEAHFGNGDTMGLGNLFAEADNVHMVVSEEED